MINSPVSSIFFDIDGTLVSFQTHRVPASASQAIKACQKLGIKVFICTGRPIFMVPDFSLPEYGSLHFDGIVAQNGGYCADAFGNAFYKCVIDPSDVRALTEFLRQESPCPVSLMTRKGVFINYIDDHVLELAQIVKVPIPTVRPLQEVNDIEVLQVNIYGGEAQVNRIMEAVLPHCEASRWHAYFADINVKGNSKATGIDRMLEHCHLPLDQTMAFGDGGNDLSMLEHVKYGYAMGNAEELVLQTARYVTASVEQDGIAQALAPLIETTSV